MSVFLLVQPILSSNRPHWAEIRAKYFSTGDNKASLSIIERVRFLILRYTILA